MITRRGFLIALAAAATGPRYSAAAMPTAITYAQFDAAYAALVPSPVVRVIPVRDNPYWSHFIVGADGRWEPQAKRGRQTSRSR